MIRLVIRMCESAVLTKTNTRQPVEWYLSQLLSDLHSQLGLFAYEANTPGHGIQNFLKVQEIRLHVFDDCN